MRLHSKVLTMSALKSISAFLAAAAVGLSVSVVYAQGVSQSNKLTNQDLPELGSPANAAISIDDEYHAGLGFVNEIRKEGVILTDPEVQQYAQEMGHSLSSQAEEGQHQFYYFIIREPSVNAFAIPGGFVAIHSGLFAAVRNENELAGVLGHEPAHVTQRHLVRQLIDQSHEGLMATAAMLAAVLLGATAGRGNPDAIEGAVLAGQSAMIQHQINYTRSSEFEADRIGITTMANAGYDPLGMASFFDYMSHNGPEPSRVNAVQFLIDHPIFSDRVAEAQDRANQIGRTHHEDSLGFLLTRERLRSVAADPRVARQYYANLLKNGGGKTIQERYGRDVADIELKNPAPAIADLQDLVREYPKVTQFYGALGQAYLVNNQFKESTAILEQAMTLFPRNVPITIRLAESLMHSGDNKRAHLVLLDLFNTVEPTPDHTRLIAKAARTAGDYADSYSYMAEFYLMTGNLQMASNQLQIALTLPGLDAVHRARYSARLEAVRPAGCVTLPPDHKPPPQDPWESWNRGVYKVNDKLDRAIAKPIARTYVKAVPAPARTGVSNFFANLRTTTVMVNDALQGKFGAAATDLARLIVNTTVGVGGLLDPASQMGLDKNDEDFGQTLGHWGVPPGPFVEGPFFGPSDTRDGPGRIVDIFTGPTHYISNNWVTYGLYGVSFVEAGPGAFPSHEP